MNDNVCPGCLSRNRATRYYVSVPGLKDRILCRHHWHDIEDEEERLIRALHKIYDVLGEIRDLISPRPVSLKVQFTGGFMSLAVGSTSTATVTVLDQNNVPMPFDFGTNVPQWTADSNASIAPGPNPNDEVFTGVSAGTENWTVTVPGVVNPMASGSFDVVAAAQVATSVSVAFNPVV